jgi:hypothetical protein
LTQLFDTFHPSVRKVRDFFRRAGCGQDYVIYNDQQNTYLALARIQMQSNGRVKLNRLIEQLCDPEEYFDDPESREVAIKQVNDVLSRYDLRVSKDGKMETPPGHPFHRAALTLAEKVSKILICTGKFLKYLTTNPRGNFC